MLPTQFAAPLTRLMCHSNVGADVDAAVFAAPLQDVVALNQHPYADKKPLLDEDMANLAKVVHSTEQTLLCLDKECTALSASGACTRSVFR